MKRHPIEQMQPGDVFCGNDAYEGGGTHLPDIVLAEPVFVDGDDGYGDVKNVVHTVQTYERMGVSAILIEDQQWPKRCGHMVGKKVVPIELAEAKIKAAASERINPETWILGRTDARAVYDLDEAMRRAERYIRAGADGIFI